jgi:hypothetical protein
LTDPEDLRGADAIAGALFSRRFGATRSQENIQNADQWVVRRMLYFVVGMAAAVPVCWLLTAFVQGQLEAMGVATQSTYQLTFSSFFVISAIVVFLMSRKTRRARAKKNRCRSVNCLTLNFRP